MSIIYTLTSHDPKNYGRLTFNTSPLIDSKIRYRIKSLSTFTCFSITTDDDYIVISRNGIQTKYYFKEKSVYENVAKDVYELINTGDESIIRLSYTANGFLKFECTEKINIIDASHRVKMLLGLYYTPLPMKEDNVLICESIPLTTFANVLYLRCKTGLVIGTNYKEDEQYKNICYKLIEILEPGLPLVSKSPGYLMTSAKEDLSQLEFELVDFMMEPVILHAPMHLSLEIYYNTLDLTPINVNEFQFNNLCV